MINYEFDSSKEKTSLAKIWYLGGSNSAG